MVANWSICTSSDAYFGNRYSFNAPFVEIDLKASLIQQQNKARNYLISPEFITLRYYKSMISIRQFSSEVGSYLFFNSDDPLPSKPIRM